MKIKGFLILTIILLSSCLIAGEKTDFAGEWILNQEKSALDEMGTQFLPVQLTVTQSDTNLTVQKLFKSDFADDMVFDEIMTLDGKECRSEFMNAPRVTVANWSENGDSLKISVTIKFENSSSEMRLNEIWTLGETLLIKHQSSSEWGERNVDMVFDKKSGEEVQ